jgi:hypothetical protein
MHHAHEVDIHYPPEQRRIGFCKRRGLRDAGIRDQDIDGLAACGCSNRRADSGVICDIGHRDKVCVAGRNGLIQRCTIAAEDGNGCSCLQKPCRDRPSDPASASGDERMQGMRRSGHAQASPDEFITQRLAYILDFKLLQEHALGQRVFAGQAAGLRS